MTSNVNSGKRKSSPTWQNLGLWVMQVLTAAFFLMSGSSKLAGAAGMVALFEAVGIGQWFRSVTGVLELLGAVLLLVPKLAGLGASILMAVLLGAVSAHPFVIGGSPALPLALLAIAAVIAWGRREAVIALWHRASTRP